MLGSPILDLALGMAFIYLLLSLIASVIQELLATLTQARAANLERGLHSLFSGDPLELGPDGTPEKLFVTALYEHGLVRGLYQDPAHDAKGKVSARVTRYQTFQLALRRKLRSLMGITPPGYEAKPNDLLLPAYIPARTFALALTDLLDDQSGSAAKLASIKSRLLDLKQRNQVALDAEKADPTPAGLVKSAGAYENKAVEALLALLLDAGGKTERFQANLENWYNDSMDRASGWYKRYVQRILLFIGLVIAIFFNVDSIRVARTLWFDHDARQGLANAADVYMKNHPNFDPASMTTVGQTAATATGSPAPTADPHATAAAGSPVTDPRAASSGSPARAAASAACGNTAVPSGSGGTSGAPAGPPAGPGSSGGPDAPAGGLTPSLAQGTVFKPQDLQRRLQDTVTSFDNVSQTNMLPVGWRHPFRGYRAEFVAHVGPSLWKLLVALIGWLITAGALSLGAPFWFDMLNKIMVVRGTVKPSEKSPVEPSKS